MYFTLAWRNLWRNHRRTLITVSSIAFAVLLALFVGSMNRGSHNQMIDNMSRFHTGFLQIQDYRFDEEPSLDNALPYNSDLAGRIAASHPGIDFLLPRIETFMLAAGEEQTRGAVVLGIDLDGEDRLNQLRERLGEGRFFEPGDGGAVVTRRLAQRLNIGVGDELVLLGQGRFGMTASGLFPVVGLLDHPLREMDNRTVYLSLPDAQWLLSADDHITALLVTPTQVRHTDDITTALRAELGDDYRVETWRDMMPDLLGVIQFDVAQQHLITGILYMVIGFGLFGTVLMMTLERMREFGVLLSVGMSRGRLALVLLIETLLISALGVAGGLLLGLPILLYFFANPIPLTGDMAEIFEEMGLGLEPVLMFSLDPDIFWLQATIIFVLAFAICLYPITKIARLNILQASRS